MRKLHHKIAKERADEYAGSQRRAFLDGFKEAMSEAESMAELRNWLEEERDEAKEEFEEDHDDKYSHVRYLTLVDVLVKISEMGCEPEVDDGAE